MATSLTKKQRELLDFITAFTSQHGYCPSYRETARLLGYNSVSTVSKHIDNLVGRGHIIKRDNAARSLEVVDASSIKQASEFEQWLISIINQKFDQAEKSKIPTQSVNDLYVLATAMRALDLEMAYLSCKSRLERFLKRASVGAKTA